MKGVWHNAPELNFILTVHIDFIKQTWEGYIFIYYTRQKRQKKGKSVEIEVKSW